MSSVKELHSFKIIKVIKKGEYLIIHIPKSFERELGIKQGNYLKAILDKNNKAIILTPLRLRE